LGGLQPPARGPVVWGISLCFLDLPPPSCRRAGRAGVLPRHPHVSLLHYSEASQAGIEHDHRGSFSLSVVAATNDPGLTDRTRGRLRYVLRRVGTSFSNSEFVSFRLDLFVVVAQRPDAYILQSVGALPPAQQEVLSLSRGVGKNGASLESEDVLRVAFVHLPQFP
jgi:hypothetical protein